MTETQDIDLGQRGDAFWCYRFSGLGMASACSSLPADEVGPELTKRVSEGMERLGIKRDGWPDWFISKDVTFKDGTSPNPSPCPDHPATHKHYLLES